MTKTTLILGADGRVHAGGLKMSGFIVDCGTTQGRRMVSEPEADRMNSDRVCRRCFKLLEDGGVLSCPHCNFTTEDKDEYGVHLAVHYSPRPDH